MPNAPEGMTPEVFEKLVKEYKESIPEKLESLRNGILGLEKKYNQEDLTSIRFIIHKMAGNAGVYGFPEASEICRPWDTKLSTLLQDFDNQTPETDLTSKLIDLANQLEAILL